MRHTCTEHLTAKAKTSYPAHAAGKSRAYRGPARAVAPSDAVQVLRSTRSQDSVQRGNPCRSHAERKHYRLLCEGFESPKRALLATIPGSERLLPPPASQHHHHNRHTDTPSRRSCSPAVQAPQRSGREGPPAQVGAAPLPGIGRAPWHSGVSGVACSAALLLWF